MHIIIHIIIIITVIPTIRTKIILG